MILLYIWGPYLIGLVLVVTWWLLAGRKSRNAGRRVRNVLLAVGLLLVLGAIVLQLLGNQALLPFEVSLWNHDWRFAAPLVLGLVAVALLAPPIRPPSTQGAADLSRRTAFSFAERSWLVTTLILLALVLVTTVVSGFASSPDPDTGKYTHYDVDLGGDRGMGTAIYGWHYSVPALAVLALLLIAAVVSMTLIARPPLGAEPRIESQVRRLRTRSVLLVVSGALLLHLVPVFGLLRGAASVRASFSMSDGPVSFWTSFAALEPALAWAATLSAVLGSALWAAAALSAFTWVPGARERALS